MDRREILERLREIHRHYAVASVHSPEFRRRHLAALGELIAEIEADVAEGLAAAGESGPIGG